MPPKTERFEMRFDPETLDLIEEWREEQPGYPSRAEAIRRLVLLGINSTKKFSDADKLLVALVSDIHRHFEIKRDPNALDPDFISSALWGGHEWALSWKYPGIFDSYVDSEDVRVEALNIIDMWYFLELAWEDFSDEQKDKLRAEVELYGNDLEFPGFDGNNESEYLGIARFVVEKLGRFERFSGRIKNSHFPSLDMHRRMLKVFQPMFPHSVAGKNLSLEEVIAILKERVHPDNR